MILADLLDGKTKSTWKIAKQCGVKYSVIRLPEKDFDVTSFSDMKTYYEQFTNFGITPIVIEPMPNHLHEHIKRGDEKRDECIEKVCGMIPILDKLNIRTICFNWMAYIGWLRTSKDITERGGATVTGFDWRDFKETTQKITAKELWDNYEYFIRAVIPYCEKYGIKLALHPDDPPLPSIGNTERIMISYENIKKAMNIIKSSNLGVTFCQATYHMMGENLYAIIPELKEKIFFVHFRNSTGNKYCFRETFHDNGDIEMGKILRFYCEQGIDVPIRVDHVPTMVGENVGLAGYGDLGRYFAIGYLKGLLEATNV